MSNSKWLVPSIAVLLAGCAAAMPVADQDKTIQQVYDVPGTSQDQIFTGAKTWVAETFNSAKAVIEYDNRDEGTLIGNGIISMPCSGLKCALENKTRVKFTMRADVKPDKFRLTFSNVLVLRGDSDGLPPLQGDFDLIKTDLLGFGPSIVKKITTGTAAKDF